MAITLVREAVYGDVAVTQDSYSAVEKKGWIFAYMSVNKHKFVWSIHYGSPCSGTINMPIMSELLQELGLVWIRCIGG